jgi:hypothetical protein
MNISNLKIATKIGAGFIVVVALTLVLGVLSFVLFWPVAPVNTAQGAIIFHGAAVHLQRAANPSCEQRILAVDRPGTALLRARVSTWVDDSSKG